MWYVLNKHGVIASDPDKRLAEMYAEIEREKSGTARVISREEKLKLGGRNPASSREITGDGSGHTLPPIREGYSAPFTDTPDPAIEHDGVDRDGHRFYEPRWNLQEIEMWLRSLGMDEATIATFPASGAGTSSAEGTNEANAAGPRESSPASEPKP